MRWIKQGLIYVANGELPWAKHYAFPPTPLKINDDTIRFYLAFCDEQNVGRIGYIEVLANNPTEILKISSQPVLDIGLPGTFDENGVLPTSLVKHDNKIYLYYVGYQLGQKIRYFQFQGLAISEDGGDSFTRYRHTPIFERSHHELHHRTSAFVMHENGIFKAWYVAGNSWTLSNNKFLPIYNMKYMESPDGIHWPEQGKDCLTFKNADEHAHGRPWVYQENGLYKMVFSSRTKSKDYRLGYAESQDGLNWLRRDEEMNIDTSATGWDSEMICYGSILTHGNKKYLFYNGNNCGKTGFGYAILAEP